MEWLRALGNSFSPTEPPIEDSKRVRSPRKGTIITDEQLDFLRATLTDMKNLAKQMDNCFGEVTAVVAQQNKILTQCELSLADAAKKMKKSKEVAKEAIRQKMQANQRDCFFSTIITLTIITGFGICFGYIWSLIDPEQ